MEEFWVRTPQDLRYEISSEGRVRSFSGKILKHLTSTGYSRVVLGGRKFYSVHKLVAENFIGLANGKEINHIDGDKKNPRVSNLEYCTRSENMKHAFRTGLQSNAGERHSQSKLTEESIVKIRELVFSGTHQSEVANLMNVDQSCISRICSGERWGHVKFSVGDVKANNLCIAG